MYHAVRTSLYLNFKCQIARIRVCEQLCFSSCWETRRYIFSASINQNLVTQYLQSLFLINLLINPNVLFLVIFHEFTAICLLRNPKTTIFDFAAFLLGFVSNRSPLPDITWTFPLLLKLFPGKEIHGHFYGSGLWEDCVIWSFAVV